MTDITELFDSLLSQTGSIDIAEAEFKRIIADDRNLQALYSEWCDVVGSTEKDGFLDYCESFRDRENDIWDALNDLDA